MSLTKIREQVKRIYSKISINVSNLNLSVDASSAGPQKIEQANIKAKRLKQLGICISKTHLKQLSYYLAEEQYKKKL